MSHNNGGGVPNYVLPPITRQQGGGTTSSTSSSNRGANNLGNTAPQTMPYQQHPQYNHVATGNPLSHVHMPDVESATGQPVQHFQYRYAPGSAQSRMDRQNSKVTTGPIPVNPKVLESGGMRGGSQYLDRRHNLSLNKPATQAYAWPLEPAQNHSKNHSQGSLNESHGSSTNYAQSAASNFVSQGRNDSSPGSRNAHKRDVDDQRVVLNVTGSQNVNYIGSNEGNNNVNSDGSFLSGSSTTNAITPAAESYNANFSFTNPKYIESARLLMDFLTNPLRCQFFACDPPLVIGEEEVEAILRSIPVMPEEIMAYLVALNTTGRVFLSINALISALRDAYNLAIHRSANDALLRAVPDADRRQIVDALTSPSCNLFAQTGNNVQATSAQLARLVLEAGSITHALELIEMLNARGRTFETMDQLIFALCAARLHEKILERVQTELLHFLQSPNCVFFQRSTVEQNDANSQSLDANTMQPTLVITPDDSALVISRAGAGVDTLLHVRALNAAQLRFESLDSLIQAIADAHVDLIRKRKLYFLSDYSFTVTDLQRQELLEFFQIAGYKLFGSPGAGGSDQQPGKLLRSSEGNSGESEKSLSGLEASSSSSPDSDILGTAAVTGALATIGNDETGETSSGLDKNATIPRSTPGVIATSEELDLLLVQGRGLLSCKSHLSAMIESQRTFSTFAELIAAVEREHLRMRNEILDYLQSNHSNLVDHSIPISPTDVDRLLIEGHAGCETLYYLRLFDAQQMSFAKLHPDLAHSIRRAHVAALNRRIDERIATLTYLYSSECRLLNKDVPTSDRAVRRLFDVGGPATRVLLESLDRAGKRFSSMATLTEAVAQERNAAAAAKRDVLAYLRSQKCNLFAVPVIDASTPSLNADKSDSSSSLLSLRFDTDHMIQGAASELLQQRQFRLQEQQQQQNSNMIVVNAATVDRLIAEGGAGTATLRVLWALEGRNDKFCSWGDLIEAIRCYQGDALEARRAARGIVRTFLTSPQRQLIVEPTRVTDADLDTLVAAARSNVDECVLCLKTLECSGYRTRSIQELTNAVRQEAVHSSAHRVELITFLRSLKCKLFDSGNYNVDSSNNKQMSILGMAEGEVILGDNSKRTPGEEPGSTQVNGNDLTVLPYNPALATSADVERLYVESGAGKFAIRYLRAMNASILSAQKHRANQQVLDQRNLSEGSTSSPSSNPVGLILSPAHRGKSFTSIAALTEAVRIEHARWVRTQEALIIFFQQQCSLLPSSMPVPISSETLLAYIRNLKSADPDVDKKVTSSDDDEASGKRSVVCIFTSLALVEVRNMLPRNVFEFLQSTQAGPQVLQLLKQFQRDKIVFPSLKAVSQAINEAMSRADEAYFSSVMRLKMILMDQKSSLLHPSIRKNLSLPDVALILFAVNGDVDLGEQILYTVDGKIKDQTKLTLEEVQKEVGTNSMLSSSTAYFESIDHLANIVNRAFEVHESHRKSLQSLLEIHAKRLFSREFNASLTSTSYGLRMENDSNTAVEAAAKLERSTKLGELANELSLNIPHAISLRKLFITLRRSAPYSDWSTFLDAAVAIARKMTDDIASAEASVLEYLSRQECILLKSLSSANQQGTAKQSINRCVFDHDIRALITAAGNDGATCLVILRLIEDEVYATLRDSSRTGDIQALTSSMQQPSPKSADHVKMSFFTQATPDGKLLNQVSTSEGLATLVATASALSTEQTERLLNFLNFGSGKSLLTMSQASSSENEQTTWVITSGDLKLLQSVVLPAGGPSLMTVLESLVRTVDRTGKLASSLGNDTAPLDTLLDIVEQRAHILARRRNKLSNSVHKWLTGKPYATTAGNDAFMDDGEEPESDLRVISESFVAHLTGAIANCSLFNSVPRVQRHLSQIQVTCMITDAARPIQGLFGVRTNRQRGFAFSSPSEAAASTSASGSASSHKSPNSNGSFIQGVGTTVSLFASTEVPLGSAAAVFVQTAESASMTFVDSEGNISEGASESTGDSSRSNSNFAMSADAGKSRLEGFVADVDQQLAFELALFHLYTLNEMGFRALSVLHLAETLRKIHQNFAKQANEMLDVLTDPRCSLFVGSSRPVVITLTDVFDLLLRAYTTSPQIFSPLSSPSDMIVQIYALQAADRRFATLDECWDEIIRILQRPSERRLAAIAHVRKFLLTEATSTPVKDVSLNLEGENESSFERSTVDAGASAPLFLVDAHPLVIPETLANALYDIAHQDGDAAIRMLRAVHEESAVGFTSFFQLVQSCANYRLAFDAQSAAVRRILLSSVIRLSSESAASEAKQVSPLIVGSTNSELHPGYIASILEETGVGLAGLACVQQLQRFGRSFTIPELIETLVMLAKRVRQEQSAVLSFLRSPKCALLARAAPDAAASLGPSDVRLLIRQGSFCAMPMIEEPIVSITQENDATTTSQDTLADDVVLLPVNIDQPTLDRLREMDHAGVQCASITSLGEALGRYARKFAKSLPHLADQLNQYAPHLAPGGLEKEWTFADASSFATRVGAGLHVSALLARVASEWANARVARAVMESLEYDEHLSPVNYGDKSGEAVNSDAEQAANADIEEAKDVPSPLKTEPSELSALDPISESASPFRSQAVLIDTLKALANAEQEERAYRLKLEQEQAHLLLQGNSNLVSPSATSASSLDVDPFRESSTLPSPRDPVSAEEEAKVAEAAAEATQECIENLRAFLDSPEADALFGVKDSNGARPSRPGEFAEPTLSLAESIYYESGSSSDSIVLAKQLCSRNEDMVKQRAELASRIVALRKELTELRQIVNQQATELARVRDPQYAFDSALDGTNSGQLLETKSVLRAQKDFIVAEEAYNATVRRLALLPLANYVANRRQLIDLIRLEYRSKSRAGAAALRVKMTEVRERQQDATMLQPPATQPSGPLTESSSVSQIPLLIPSLVSPADKLAIAQYLAHPDCGLFAGAGPNGVRLTGTDMLQLLSAARSRQRCLAHLLSLDSQRQVFTTPARLIQAVVKESEQFLRRRRELLLYLWSPACLCLSDRSKSALTAADAETLLLLPRTGGDSTALQLVLAVLAELDLIVQSGGEAVVERRGAAIRMLGDDALLVDKTGSAVAASANVIADSSSSSNITSHFNTVGQSASGFHSTVAPTSIASAVSVAAASIGAPGDPFTSVADLIEVVRRAWPLCARAAKAVEQQQRRAIQRRVAAYQSSAFESISRFLADPSCCLFSRTLQSVVVTDKNLAQLLKSSQGILEVSLASLRELEGSPGPIGFPPSTMFESLPDPAADPMPIEKSPSHRLKPLTPELIASVYTQSQSQASSIEPILPMETIEQAQQRRLAFGVRSRALSELVGEGGCDTEELWPATYCDSMEQLIGEVSTLVSQRWVSYQADLLVYFKQPSVWALLFGDAAHVLPGGQSRENLTALDVMSLWNMGLSGRRTLTRVKSFVRAREGTLSAGLSDSAGHVFDTFASWSELSSFIRFQEERRLAAAARWRRISLHVRDAVHMARRPNAVSQGRQLIRTTLVDSTQPVVLFDPSIAVYVTGSHIADLYEAGDVEARARAAEREQRELLLGATASKIVKEETVESRNVGGSSQKEEKEVTAAVAALESLGISKADCNWTASGGAGPSSTTLFYLRLVESLIHWSRSDALSSSLPANRRLVPLQSADELVLVVQSLVRLGVTPSPLGPAVYEPTFIRLVPAVVLMMRKQLREMSEGREERNYLRRLRQERQKLAAQQREFEAGEPVQPDLSDSLSANSAAETALIIVPESNHSNDESKDGQVGKDALGVHLGPHSSSASLEKSSEQSLSLSALPPPIPSTAITFRVSIMDLPVDTNANAPLNLALARGVVVRSAQRGVVGTLLSSTTSNFEHGPSSDGAGDAASAFTLTDQQTEVQSRGNSPVFSTPLTVKIPSTILQEALAALATKDTPALKGALECKLVLQPQDSQGNGVPVAGTILETPEAGKVLAEVTFSLADLLFSAASSRASVLSSESNHQRDKNSARNSLRNGPTLVLPFRLKDSQSSESATIHIWLAKLNPIPSILRAIMKSFQIGDKGLNLNAPLGKLGEESDSESEVDSSSSTESGKATSSAPRVVFRMSCSNLRSPSDGSLPNPKIVLLVPKSVQSSNPSMRSGVTWVTAGQESELSPGTNSPSFFTVFALPAPKRGMTPPLSCVRLHVIQGW